MRLISISILFLLSGSVYGQVMNVPSTTHTPGGNVPMNNYIFINNYRNTDSNPKFEVVATLKNDSVIKFKSRMFVDDKKLYFKIKVKKSERRIFPDDTKQVIVNLTSTERKYGIPADSCWLFGLVRSKISCYSSQPLSEVDGTIAIEKGKDGNIVALNKENLKGMIDSDDEKIQKWIENGKLIKAINRYNQLQPPSPVKK